MRSIKFLFILLLGLFSLFPSYMMAAKLAPFPSSASLQPIPSFAHPNVSGNIDHQAATGNYQNINTSSEDSSTTTSLEQKTENHSNILFWFSVWLATISSFFAILLMIMRRK